MKHISFEIESAPSTMATLHHHRLVLLGCQLARDLQACVIGACIHVWAIVLDPVLQVVHMPCWVSITH